MRPATPLGSWIKRQRTAYTADTPTGLRPTPRRPRHSLEPTDAASDDSLDTTRAYYTDHGTHAAPLTATALDTPIGQWLPNQRRPGFLADHPERAEARAEIDPNWNPAWPLDRQRHYAGVREALAAGATLDELVPG
ncbi:helicase associated domain-containing protein [Uniformispora flossi]|uniref:helicase associated domain-containing protein n=1 Tax=Uniformispora flossi TaxID=3390723 RepID=UPI003C2C4F57